MVEMNKQMGKGIRIMNRNQAMVVRGAVIVTDPLTGLYVCLDPAEVKVLEDKVAVDGRAYIRAKGRAVRARQERLF